MSYEARNRSHWDSHADDYQATHGAFLDDAPEAWGIWRIPEDEVAALGEVDGCDVLELGCGGAQWAISLAGRGARVVAYDLSQSQLHHAASGIDAAGVAVPLVCGAAESLPFRDASFDTVFCDHGALSFADPFVTIAEAARVLREGGRLAFCQATPIRMLTDDGEHPSRRLERRYFGMHRFDWDGVTTVEYQLTYGDWIRLFRRHGLAVEDLLELRAPKGATTTYDYYVPYKWARRWPAEQIWRLRKE